jgi:DNA-3-methyladenine glycosylase II
MCAIWHQVSRSSPRALNKPPLNEMSDSLKPPHLNYETAILALRQADPALAAVIDRVGSCRLDREQQSGDLLEAIAEGMIYQQISTKAAAAIHRKFCKLYADRGCLTAQGILETSNETLKSAGLSNSKVTYLKDLAWKIQQGMLALAELETMTDEDAIRALTQIKGVGVWTAQRFLIFRLHRWDVLPVDDLVIRKGIQQAHQLATLPDRKTADRIGQLWKPYRTIAAWYLWLSINPKPPPLS